MRGLIATIVARPIVAGVVISAITLILVGGVVLTMTSAGCGPAKALHLKSIENHCAALTAGLSSPAPSASASPAASNQPTPIYEQPSPTNPITIPASGPFPPYDPGSSAGNPFPGPSSGSYPPFFPPSSVGGAGQTYSLTCSLPVYAGGPGSGGFITFPGGAFVADPRSGVVLPSPSPGSPSPPPPGYGQQGISGLTYDRAHSRWLPVQRTWVTPDGTRYAYPSPDSIYVQNAADAGQIELGIGHSWAIVSVEANGVYATNPTISGLWFLPFTGAAKQITNAGYWQAAAAGFAYGTVTSAVPQGAANTIVRLDLNTGAQVDFFTRTASSSSIVAFDTKGHPIIQVYTPNGAEIWLATGPNVSTLIVFSSGGFNPNGVPVADSHGIWFPGYANNVGADIALYIAGQGLYSMATLGAQIAGGCN